MENEKPANKYLNNKEKNYYKKNKNTNTNVNVNESYTN